MKLKTSLFSGAIISNNLKRYWWTSTLYTIILFLIGPMILSINLAESTLQSRNTDYIIQRLKGSNTLFYIVIPIFIGAMLFRYIQNSRSVTLMHSMPYTRKTLFSSNLISGFILLIVPTLINTLIMVGILKFSAYGNTIPSLLIWKWFAESSLIQITLYTLTVMVGMFTGSSIAQIIFTFIINILPIFFITSLSFLFKDFIYGFMDLSDYYIENAAKFIPILQISKTLSDIWLIDLLLILVTIAIGLFVYERRHLETSGDVISSSIIKPVFKYGVTVCAMLTGACYIKALYNNYNPNILVFIFFALIGYVISEMLIRKSFYILSSYKGFLGFLIVLIAIIGGIKYDVIGFERRLPNPADVSSIAFGYRDDVRCLVDSEYYNNRFANNQGRYDYYPKILNESQNIKNVVALHNLIIKNTNHNNSNDTISIGYKLKNGKYILRNYKVDQKALSEQFNAIYNTLEYKKLAFGILNMDVSKIKDLYIKDFVYAPTPVRLTDLKQIDEVLILIKKHIADTPYQHLTSNLNSIYNIDIAYEAPYNQKDLYAEEKTMYSSISVSVNKYGKTLMDELAALGYNNVLVKPNDVKKIIIRENISSKEFEYSLKVRSGYPMPKEYIDTSNSGKVVKTITDKIEVKKLLDNRGDLLSYSPQNQKFYAITIVDKNNSEFILGYSDKI